MSTATKTTKPHPATLPVEIDVPAEVAELSEQAATKLQYREQALEALTAAEEALDRAQEDDTAATRKAVENNKPGPASCIPDREEQVKAARRTLKVANDLAQEAIDQLEAALVTNRKQLVEAQRERTERAAAEAEKHLAAFEQALTHTATEAGLLYGLLHEPKDNEQVRNRTNGRSVPKIRRKFQPTNLDRQNHIKALKQNLYGIYERTAGRRLLILETLKEAGKPLNNSQIAEAIGVSALDHDYRQVRKTMLANEDIVLCDEHGTIERGDRTNPYLPQNPCFKLAEPKRRKHR